MSNLWPGKLQLHKQICWSLGRPFLYSEQLLAQDTEIKATESRVFKLNNLGTEEGGPGKGVAKGPGPWAEKQWLVYGLSVLDQLVEGWCGVSLAGPLEGCGDMALKVYLGVLRPLSS